MRVRPPTCFILTVLSLTAASLAERSGVVGVATAEDFGDYGCLQCKLAAMRLMEAEGSDSVRFEAGTGRDLRNFAPDRPADLKHMRLEFDGDKLVGALALGFTQHVGVLRGLIQTGVSLGPWKDKLMYNPMRVMEAYLARVHLTSPK